jgi:hypothetical protein
MNRLELPVNIRLMDTRNERVANFRKVSSLDTFDGMNTNSFHPKGLFSTEIFGRVGTPERDRNMAFIHTKITILNPFIFKKIIQLKALYKEIITGKQYAVWNEEIKDFESSDMVNGDTGYYFFLTHLPSIEFKKTQSVSREMNIELVNKSINDGTCFVTNVPVIPAGLRDAYIEADGRVSEDEINSLYRSLIASANAIPDTGDYDTPIYNTTRVTLQNALNNVFEYLWNLYSGKSGFAQQQFFSRGVFNGTRNVLSAGDTATPKLGVAHCPKMNNTTIGLFQAMKALLPVTQYLMLNGWLRNVFASGDGRAYLVDRKTRRQVLVTVDRHLYDRFTTPQGIEKCINAYFNRKLRRKPVIIDGHYIGLVYRGEVDGVKVFKFFNDINDLPKHLDPKDVHPISWVELFYVAGYRHWYRYPMVNTRYPVAGLGSTYPSIIYVKTTTSADQRYELDDDWNILKFNDDNPIKYAYEYPDLSVENFIETASVHVSRLAGLTADFDGDTGSQIAIYTLEAMEELNTHFGQAASYLNPKGGFLNSPYVDTVERVIVGLMRR